MPSPAREEISAVHESALSGEAFFPLATTTTHVDASPMETNNGSSSSARRTTEQTSSPSTAPATAPVIASVALGIVTGLGLFALMAPKGSLQKISGNLFGSTHENASTAVRRTKETGKVSLRAHRPPGDGAGSQGDLATLSRATLFVTGSNLEIFFNDLQTTVFPSGRPVQSAAFGVRAHLRRNTGEGTPPEPPVVITRGQFLDVVTRKMPSSLPTSSGRDGAVFHAVADADISSKALSGALQDLELAHDSLCNPTRHLDTSALTRVTLFFHATKVNLDCVKAFLSQAAFEATGNKTKQGPKEITLIALSSSTGFFGARQENGVTLTLQTWESAWLDTMVANWEDDSTLPPPARRARRLAQTARALGQASDVVIDLPFAKSDTSPFGNFVALPRSLASGTVRARRIGEAVRKSHGKEASWTLSQQTSLLVVSGVGKDLKFESFERR